MPVCFVKVLGRDIPGTSGAQTSPCPRPRHWDVPDKNFMQGASFCCFRQRSWLGCPAIWVGTSQDQKNFIRVPPDVGLAPSTAGGPSPSTPPKTPPPTPDWAAPSRTPGASQKKPRGVGGRGREGFWLEGRVLQLQWGMGGDPPNTSWGQTHIWGLPIYARKLWADVSHVG